MAWTQPGLKLLPELSLQEAVDTFRRGEGDFIHLPLPAAEQLIADETAHVAIAVGPANGHIAFSSFAATNSYLDANQEVVHRFIRGYARALAWLSDNDPTAIGEAIASFFPDVPKELIVRSVARYEQQDTWPSTPDLNEPEVQSLQDILMAAGLVKERQPYSKVVRPEFLQAALA